MLKDRHALSTGSDTRLIPNNKTVSLSSPRHVNPSVCFFVLLPPPHPTQPPSRSTSWLRAGARRPNSRHRNDNTPRGLPLKAAPTRGMAPSGAAAAAGGIAPGGGAAEITACRLLPASVRGWAFQGPWTTGAPSFPSIVSCFTDSQALPCIRNSPSRRCLDR